MLFLEGKLALLLGRLPALPHFRGLWLRRFQAGFGADTGAALRHHVGIAASIFRPAPAAFSNEDRGRNPIEKVAIVARENDGAFIVGKHLLQQIERLEIEIVGRLVEDEEIGRHG